MKRWRQQHPGRKRGGAESLVLQQWCPSLTLAPVQLLLPKAGPGSASTVPVCPFCLATSRALLLLRVPVREKLERGRWPYLLVHLAILKRKEMTCKGLVSRLQQCPKHLKLGFGGLGVGSSRLMRTECSSAAVRGSHCGCNLLLVCLSDFTHRQDLWVAKNGDPIAFSIGRG